jgi:hypothetical protein
MANRPTASCFWTIPSDGTGTDLDAALQAFVKKKKTLRFDWGRHEYLICEPRLGKQDDHGIVAASVFKVRSSAWPSVVSDTGPEPLTLEDGKSLAEPMCFAWHAVDQVALVYTTKNGPSASVLAAFAQAIGFQHDLEIDAVIRTDIMERLDKTNFVRALTFGVTGVTGRPDLRRAGVPVELAFDLAGSLHGANVEVRVSIGKNEPGLAVSVVKKVAKHLYDVGDTAVTSLRLEGAEQLDQKCEKLDLLNARLVKELDVAEDARELNRRDCQQKLIQVLQEVRLDLQSQRSSRRQPPSRPPR